MSNPIIEVELRADDKGIKNTFKDLKKTAEKDGSSIGEAFSGALQKSGFNIGTLTKGGLAIGATVGVAVAAYKGLSAVLRTGFDEAQKTEDAINALNVALKNTGQFTPSNTNDLKRFAEALSDVTTVGDDAIISTSALIQSLGALDKEGLQRATKAALNLSAALGVDLNSAAQLVGKAAAGEVGSLSRYGLVIEKGATQAETFERVLTKLEQKFSGAAESKVSTFSGALAQLGIAFGDLSKAVVGYITNSDLIQSAIRGTTALLKATTQLINPDKGTLSDQIKNATDELEALKQKEASYQDLIKNRTLGNAREALNAKLNIQNIQSEIVARQALIENLRLQEKVGGSLSDQALKVVAGLSPEQLSQIYENGKLIGLTQEQVLLENFAKNQELVAQLRENELISEIEFNERRVELERQYQEQLTKLREDGAAKRSAAEIKQEQLSKTLGIQANQALTNGISMGVQSMVKSFILGEKSGQNFLGAMLGILGDLSIQMGQTLVFAGLGIESLFALQGAGAIAAGAGLIALGTILKSFAGSNGGPSTDVGGGAGESLLSQGQSQLAQQQERAEPETRVVVNVQGSILDSEETGLRISNILKEASLNNNVKASVFA